MKNTIAFFLILSFVSCDDGNFETPSFEFEDKVNYCGEFVLYRLSIIEQKEALIVTLTDNQIQQSEDLVAPVGVTATGAYTVTYRIFDSKVSSSYFCQTVPPVEPLIVKNWTGVAGTIFVKNEAVYDDDEITIIAYKHIVVLNDLVLTNNDETLLFDPSYLYGEFETKVE